MHTILVLGGYGFFGGRICAALHGNEDIRLLIGGRQLAKARSLCDELGLGHTHAVGIDARDPALAQRLAELQVNTVIHTAGPFQGQDYAVAKAAIAAGANYIDLADGRDFVANIGSLNAEAAARGVLVTSGASSLPALSSAVVDRYAPRFARLERIRHGIASGARSPGLATMTGIFSYCGKPFTRLHDGQWRSARGWLGLERYRFPHPVGNRLLGACDVPDLVLFPQRYPQLRSVSFQAGFASMLGHLVVWAGAQGVRFGLLRSMRSWARPLHRIARWMEPLVSDKGGMFVEMEGVGHDGAPLALHWHVLAARNHGPHIPCGAAIALARKLARGDALPRGAMPCVGLLSVEEYLGALKGLDVREVPA
ncbi:saccharopine dehydrogenase family protein [Massilia endophytica]|uniref:saccharopine dehydrogenase family protein n=1 Tax=Massilia endophytica TaxID=2899220 RepID=UPI001E39C211|nr:saccharopine dehydrogenase NADP-binding domain-containing protein [Massilia endophytica]UGQ46714.1 saccharopine dehydrogenase NADP-binding domain-containing protein [Massilia endophytica]